MQCTSCWYMMIQLTQHAVAKFSREACTCVHLCFLSFAERSLCMPKHVVALCAGAGPVYQYMTNAGLDDPRDQLARARAPCVSSGVWAAHPHPITATFLLDVIERVLKVHTQWEQAAFNEVLANTLSALQPSVQGCCQAVGSAD